MIFFESPRKKYDDIRELYSNCFISYEQKMLTDRVTF